jgi:hypothetical protein
MLWDQKAYAFVDYELIFIENGQLHGSTTATAYKKTYICVISEPNKSDVEVRVLLDDDDI